MAKKKQPQARSGPKSQPATLPNQKADTLPSHREANMRIQHFTFDAEMFDSANHDHLVVLETILTLNRGMQLEDFSYRGSVFTGSEETSVLELHWLALLFCHSDSGRLSFQLHPCQAETIVSKRELVGRILSIRTGHEGNPGTYNETQKQRWANAAKLVADWQMPISMVALATCEQEGPTNLNLRLYVPDQPESVYNTMALGAWRLAIEAV